MISIVVKRKFGKTWKKVSKYYDTDCPQNFLFLFMFLIKVKLVKNSHIYGCIFFIFLKNVLKQTQNSFNTKFQHHWKDKKSSYQEKQVLGLFCHLIALVHIYVTTVWKVLELQKKRKKVKFEGVWGELKSRKSFLRQQLTKYRRLTLGFMWNRARSEKFNFYFSRDFL